MILSTSYRLDVIAFLLLTAILSSIVSCFCKCVIYLVVVIDELQRESGVGQLHGLQQRSIGRLTRLQCPLTPVFKM